jgi:putative pyruvate formate lyase activating enzyme
VPERAGVRLRLLEDGGLEIVDPDLRALPLLRALDPLFAIRQEPLPGFTRPRLLRTRALGTGIAPADLGKVSTGDLWRAHEAGARIEALVGGGEASLLDLKIELAGRLLRCCILCGHRCRVDRTRGERGRCGLGMEAFVYEHYVHIAEEPPINPALNLSLRGCGLRCHYCQQSAALSPRGAPAEALMPALWSRLALAEARSLTFVGGNPTESLPALLTFLRTAPADFAVPVGWNCSGYDAVEAVQLLAGICDVYIPDFKYGNAACAARWSDAPGYVETACQSLEAMCRQAVPVFVRILVLPGHVDCCHAPALQLLQPFRSRIRLNILGQYAPDFRIRDTDGVLASRVGAAEVACVRRRALELGFSLF